MGIEDLELVGGKRKRSRRELVAAFGAARKHVPGEYVELMSTYGPGELCGFIELLDPTVTGGRHASLQAALRERGSSARARGMWVSCTNAQLRTAALLGVDRMGAALIASEDRLFVLQPYGAVHEYDSFDEIIDDHLLGSGLTDALWPQDVMHVAGYHQLELDVPAIYATDRAPSADAWDAIARADRAAAEAAVARFAGREVLPYAWLDLMARVATAEANAGSADLRDDMVADLYTLAKRKFPALVARIPQRELRGANVLELRERLQAECRVLFSTIFDHDASVGEDVDSDLADRGLVAPAGYPVDVEARLRAFVDEWRAGDPATSIEPLLERLNALPRAVRDGYVMLVARLDHNENLHPALHTVPDAEQYLGPEIADAWPMLALALRSGDSAQAETALELLREHQVTEAAPYLKSIIEHPASYTSEAWQGEVVYAELAELSEEESIAMFLGFVAPGSKASPRRKSASYEALATRADDDRVFAMFLERFGAAWPHSEEAIENAGRWDDSRVMPALRDALRAEARSAEAGRSSRDVEYGPAYEAILERLAALGDAEAAATLAAYLRRQQRDDDL